MQITVSAPIDKLSLRTFINDNLDPNIQQTFAVDSYLNVVDRLDEKYPVRGVEAFEWLGYDTKGNLKRFFTKHLQEGVDYEVTLSPSTGGRPAEDVSFTADAFKNLCMLANTDRGRMVRKYYIALDDLVRSYISCQTALERVKMDHVIETMSTELAFTETLLIEASASSAESAMDAIHKTLTETYAHTQVVYLAFMEQLSEAYWVLKIGSTKHTPDRDPALQAHFGKVRFLYIIAVRQHERYEKYLLKHPTIKPFKCEEIINPETLELVDHFSGPTEAIRQFENGCPQILMKAVKECTVYKRFRWATVPRDGDPTTPQAIGATVESREGGGGMVAVYSRDGSSIEHVFPDQLGTKQHLNVKSAATICQAIKSDMQRKCAGVYVQMWADVPQALQEAYLETKQLPGPAERKGGRPVLQLDMYTNQVIARHGNIAKVAKDFRMSHMTVKAACESGEAHAGFLWTFA